VAQNTDSIEVNSYKLNLDFRQIKTKQMKGIAEINFQPAFGKKVKTARFWLLKLNVDSVYFKTTGSSIYRKVSFSYNDTFIKFQEWVNGVADAKIFYHGSPVQDASWGGFYFSNEYAYNMGVGFVSDPHPFGRVWFPCLDNFTDRATYEYSVKVPTGYTAVCGGLLKDTVSNSDNTVSWNWIQTYAIPTYLASVAIAPYKLLYDEFTGINRSIQIILAAQAKDTSNLKKSFVNLKSAIEAFESFYGPYRFERVGYNLVPFFSGAMEHACNIAYPLYAADGNLTNEALFMAHELSHHWWGNNTTCLTAGDMWLNEGWASYSEAIFVEKVYGTKAYKDYINNLHKNVLQFAHLSDGSATAVNNVSHSNTYGSHVYKKGADMVHCFRGVMGDADFKNKCQTLMESKKQSNISTQDFINHFNDNTALPKDYIKQLISDTGFCHFSIFNTTTTNDGSGFKTELSYTQRKRFGHHVYDEMPYEIYAFDKNFNFQIIKANLGKANKVSFQTPFIPVFICFDYDQKFSDAITDDVILTASSGPYNLKNAMMNVVLSDNSDTSLIRVEHNWVHPDGYFIKLPNVIISKERYWKVDGIFDPSLKMNAIINYDGSKPANYSSGWLDNQLLEGRTEDSLVLLYREKTDNYWKIETDVTQTIGGKLDKKGSFKINNLKKGEYAFGIRGKVITSGYNNLKEDNLFNIFPNPANDKLTVAWNENIKPLSIEISNILGQSVFSSQMSSGKTFHEIDTKSFESGLYYVSIVGENSKKYTREVSITR
jgi:hypothetical protein